MRKFLTAFWASAVSIAGIIGLYLGADQAKLMWAFWVVIPLALGCALIVVFGRQTIAALARIQEYPRVAQRVEVLEAEVEGLESTNSLLSAGVGVAWSDGLNEGMARVWGAILARDAALPTLIAVAEFEGSVALVADLSDEEAPELGARFVVQSARTGAIKGVVELCEGEGTAGARAFLRVVEPTSAPFWESLAERVAFDDSLPSGIELRAFEIGTNHLSPERPTAKVVGPITDATEEDA